MQRLEWVSNSLQDVHVSGMVLIVSDKIVRILIAWSVSHVLFYTFFHYSFWYLSLEAFVSSIVEFVVFIYSSLPINVNVWNRGQKVRVGKAVMVVLNLVDNSFFLILTSNLIISVWCTWRSRR